MSIIKKFKDYSINEDTNFLKNLFNRGKHNEIADHIINWLNTEATAHDIRGTNKLGFRFSIPTDMFINGMLIYVYPHSFEVFADGNKLPISIFKAEKIIKKVTSLKEGNIDPDDQKQENDISANVSKTRYPVDHGKRTDQ